jgi:hypothetical protein
MCDLDVIRSRGLCELVFLALRLEFTSLLFSDEIYRCFLHWQITGSTRSRDSSFEVVFVNNKHRRIYLGLGPFLEIIAIHPVG